jgi:hypothetical protein
MNQTLPAMTAPPKASSAYLQAKEAGFPEKPFERTIGWDGFRLIVLRLLDVTLSPA